MATVTPNGGVNEREPTLIGDNQLQDCVGCEYRVGQPGLFVARGRSQIGDLGSVTAKGLYEAGFDGSSQYIVAHEGSSLYAGKVVAGTVSFSRIDGLTDSSLPVVGAHYANRHYIATNVGNRRLEAVAATGVTSFPIGMSATSFVVGTSIAIGSSGSMTADIGMEYWATEYDSVRGIESVFGSTANTGAFSGVSNVVVTVTGVSANPRADQLRWYRSTPTAS
jgi:hypothetical protein